jgi:hypothetical protein
LSHLTSDSYQRPTLHFNLYVEGLVTPACFPSGDATAMFVSPYTDRSYWLPRTTLPRGSASNSGKTDRIIYRRVTIVAHQMLHILVVCRIPALNWKHEREKKKIKMFAVLLIGTRDIMQKERSYPESNRGRPDVLHHRGR